MDSTWETNPIVATGTFGAGGSFSATYTRVGTENRFFRVAAVNGSGRTLSSNAGGFYTVRLPADVTQLVAYQFDEVRAVSDIFTQLPNNSRVTYTDAGGAMQPPASKNPAGTGWNAQGAGLLERGAEAMVFSSGAARDLMIAGTLSNGKPKTKGVAPTLNSLAASSLPVSGAPNTFGITLSANLRTTQADASGGPIYGNVNPAGTGWTPPAPNIRVGEAFMLMPGSVGKTWTQELVVPPADFQLTTK